MHPTAQHFSKNYDRCRENLKKTIAGHFNISLLFFPQQNFIDENAKENCKVKWLILNNDKAKMKKNLNTLRYVDVLFHLGLVVT